MCWKQNQHPRSWRQASSGGLVSAGICKSYISSKNSCYTHSNFTGGFAFNDSMQFWHCCVLFVLPCNSLESPLCQWHSGWAVQAGKCNVRASLQEDRAFSKVSISTSAPHLQGWRKERDPLWNTVNINVPATLPGNVCIFQRAEKKEGRSVCPRGKSMSLQILQLC